MTISQIQTAVIIPAITGQNIRTDYKILYKNSERGANLKHNKQRRHFRLPHNKNIIRKQRIAHVYKINNRSKKVGEMLRLFGLPVQGLWGNIVFSHDYE